MATEEVKKTPTVQDSFKARETASQENIGKVYDANLSAQKQGLLDAFNNSTTAQNTVNDTIKQNYAMANNDMDIQASRNDTGLKSFANVRDMNSGTGSQHQLGFNMAKNAGMGQLAFAQQQAMQDSQRRAALLETNYKNQIASALADNDYKRAAALMDDYNNQNAWREQQAATLASYGNFSGYNDLYGNDAAGAMQKVWNAQNPEVAYRSGRISADQYKNITGQYPRGYTPPWSGGGWGDEGGPIRQYEDDQIGSKYKTYGEVIVARDQGKVSDAAAQKVFTKLYQNYVPPSSRK